MLIDTHCHLDFPDFDGDRDAVVERALRGGVERVIVVGIDVPSSQKAVQLAETYECLYAAVGVHPHDASTWSAEAAREIARLARHPKVVAIGETGLDYYRDRSPRDQQRAAFRAHLDLARAHGLPIIVHDRDAHDDVTGALLTWAQDGAVSGVVHCFSGTLSMAEALTERGFYVSFTGTLTYQKPGRRAGVARRLPLSTILVETDAPFLTPQPWRGQRNEPAFVAAVAERLAELRGVPLDVVAEATSANALRLFGLS